jgi:hypothetical protein
MNTQDEFDALLQGAASNFGQESLSEQALSTIIDERLIESRNRLRTEFRKEILLISLTLTGIIYLLAGMYRHPHQYKPDMLYALRIAISGGVIYLAGSIVLFLKLIQVAKLQKDTGIRTYLQDICTKTGRALWMYVWISTIASTGALATVLVRSPELEWYYVVAVIALMGTGMYYLNSWYTNRRFGKRLREMRGLLEEFA